MDKHNVSRISNKLQDFALTGLSVIEQNLWWALVSKLKDKGTKTLVFTRKEIEYAANYSAMNNSNMAFYNDMMEMGHKVVALSTQSQKVNEQTGKLRGVVFSVFPVFEVEEDKIIVKVSDYFEPWFNRINENFTLIDFSIIVKLHSKYSKSLYSHLRQWSGNKRGYWVVKFDDFRRLIDVPTNYCTSDIKRRVLDPAIKELTKEDNNSWAPFKTIDYQLIYEKGSKRVVNRVEFYFEAAPLPKELKAIEVNQLNNAKEPHDSKPIHDAPDYSNNFATKYINNQSLSVEQFKSFLERTNFYVGQDKNNRYFKLRKIAKRELVNLYSIYVDNSDEDNSIWTDMSFLCAVQYTINENKPMRDWQIEDALVAINDSRYEEDALFSANFLNKLTTNESKRLQEVFGD